MHLAVIMDGNRRWAKSRGLPAMEGHRAGVKALKKLVQVAPKHGITYLTAYTFSTENWKRPEEEKSFLFNLLKTVALKELSELIENNVRVRFLGDVSAFPQEVSDVLNDLAKRTKNNTGLSLQLALNYGSLDEIKHAAQVMKAKLSPEEISKITEEDFSKLLYSEGVPDPDLVLRTGGDKRLSNFLLWQAVNARLEFIETLWPDFNENELLKLLEGSQVLA